MVIVAEKERIKGLYNDFANLGKWGYKWGLKTSDKQEKQAIKQEKTALKEVLPLSLVF